MLNFSPVENRALKDVNSTSTVFSNLSRFNLAQLILACTACALMFSMFIYVCNLNSNEYTFLIVYIFLMCSITGLYAFYRFKALAVLRERSMENIADSANITEQQRLKDKAIHRNLTYGGNEVFTNVNDDVAASNIKADMIGENLLTSTTSDVVYADNGDKYRRDSYIFDNVAVILFVAAVNLGALIIFGVIG